MRNGRFIIGVMGPSRGMSLPKDAPLATLAHQIGAAVATASHILLTGGQPSAGSSAAQVKTAAMNGASSVAGARVISVLPRTGGFRIVLQPGGTFRHLFINTDFGDERNFINGCVSDVVIAAGAGAGTFSELAIAHAAGVPIVCMQVDGVIDTVARLRAVPANGTSGNPGYDDLLKVIAGKFPDFDPARVAADLLDHLAAVLTAADAAQAVKDAIRLAGNRPLQSRNALPNHPSLASISDEYERQLDLL